jgi:hypothetical protein
MAHDVFICFSSIDQQAADTVLARLEKEGVHCWISSRDMGAGWFTQKLTDAIMECRILVLVFSAHSNNSEYCINEVHTAFNKKGMVVPFVIDNSLPTGDMSFYLQRYQRIDAHGKVNESSLQRLVNEVKEVIAQLSPLPPPEVKPSAAASTSIQTPDSAHAPQPAPTSKTGKGKIWLWAGAAIILIAAAALVLRFTVFNGNTGTTSTPPGDNNPAISQTTLTTTEPTTTAPTVTTTPPPKQTTPAISDIAPPKEYVELAFKDTVIDPDIITGNQPFNITLNGSFTCVKDIPYSINGLTIKPIIRALRYGETTYTDLITSSNITASEVPLVKGETIEFSQILEVQFPDTAASGKYDIYFNVQKIKIDIGIWVDIEEFFQLEEQFLGVVDYTASAVGIRTGDIYAATQNIFYVSNKLFELPYPSRLPAADPEPCAMTTTSCLQHVKTSGRY